MNNKDKTITLLEQRIEKIARRIIGEQIQKKLNESNANDKEEAEMDDADYNKVGEDFFVGDVSTSKAYKRRYKEVQKKLDDETVNATQVMSNALGFKASDDTARSHAFKKLHQEKTADGESVYKFSPSELLKIRAQLDQ